MSRVAVSGGIDGRLVEWRRDNRRHAAVQRKLRRRDDSLRRRGAGPGVDGSHGHVLQITSPGVVDLALINPPVQRVQVHGGDVETHCAGGPFHRPQVTDHDGPAGGSDLRVRQGLRRDLRSDSGRITHGDGNQRTIAGKP